MSAEPGFAAAVQALAEVALLKQVAFDPPGERRKMLVSVPADPALLRDAGLGDHFPPAEVQFMAERQADDTWKLARWRVLGAMAPVAETDSPGGVHAEQYELRDVAWTDGDFKEAAHGGGGGTDEPPASQP
jgi:hypothetical protein